jgi:16S rRNA (guanine527-N7)-methyltransferase
MVSAADIQALRNILSVSRETVDKLAHYLDLLQRWSGRINLIGPATRNDMWVRHVVDSAQIVAIAKGMDRQWVDIGSGAGFPGMITAILMTENSGDGRVHLVESNNKKAAFLRQVAIETGARAHVHAQRVESLDLSKSQADHVSARAVTELGDLLRLADPWLSQSGAVGYFHKGRDYRVEVDNARGDWGFDLVEHPSRIDRDSVILEVRNVERHGGRSSKGRP